MKSIALIVVFAGVLALSQGSAIQSRRSSLRTVEWSCNLSAIEDLVKDLVSDARSVVEDLRTDVTDAISTAEDCVEAFLSDLDISALVSCVTDDVQSTISSVESTVENFLEEAESTAAKIEVQVKKCITL